MAIGNAIGSNIANVGMVLGITAMIVPLPFKPEVLRNDLPIMIVVTLCAGAALYDLQLTPLDGVLLLFGLVLFLLRIFLESKKSTTDKISSPPKIDELSGFPEMSMPKAALNLVLSLVFLLLSAELLVYSVVAIARLMGVSELIIGLTVIAVGTSLPELVVSVTGAIKGQTDLAVGNIIGSNIFNILTVLAVPCLLAPTQFDSDLLWRDYGVMLGMALIMAVFAYGILSRALITRWEGLLLFLIWCTYLTSLYYTNAGVTA